MMDFVVFELNYLRIKLDLLFKKRNLSMNLYHALSDVFNTNILVTTPRGTPNEVRQSPAQHKSNKTIFLTSGKRSRLALKPKDTWRTFINLISSTLASSCRILIENPKTSSIVTNVPCHV